MQTPVNELLESPISAMLAVYHTLTKTMGEHLTIVIAVNAFVCLLILFLKIMLGKSVLFCHFGRWADKGSERFTNLPMAT